MKRGRPSIRPSLFPGAYRRDSVPPIIAGNEEHGRQGHQHKQCWGTEGEHQPEPNSMSGAFGRTRICSPADSFP